MRIRSKLLLLVVGSLSFFASAIPAYFLVLSPAERMDREMGLFRELSDRILRLRMAVDGLVLNPLESQVETSQAAEANYRAAMTHLDQIQYLPTINPNMTATVGEIRNVDQLVSNSLGQIHTDVEELTGLLSAFPGGKEVQLGLLFNNLTVMQMPREALPLLNFRALMLYRHIQETDQGFDVITALVEAKTQWIGQEIQNWRTRSLIAALAVIVVVTAGSVLLSFWMARDISGSLRLIDRRIGQLSAGQTEDPIVLGRKDEIGSVIENLNVLTAKLQERDQLRIDLEKSLETLRQTQAQMVLTEKMAVLGGLVAGVAHEINTPLGTAVTAQSLVAELLAAPPQAGSTDQTLADALALTRRSLEKIVDLVNLFKQTAVDQTSDTQRTFRLAEYLGRIIRSLGPQVVDRGHRIDLDCPQELMVTTYPGALTQIVSNLVLNAVIHGFKHREGGQVTIRIHRLTDQSLEMILEDDGQGLDPHQLAHLFEPFRPGQRQHGGPGLGTYAVYNLVTQRLKGTIQAESRPGEGLRYTIRIPVESVPVAEVQEAEYEA